MFSRYGRDHPCIMEGVGTIQIKMFDGMIRKLKEERYVPQLKRNLISIGVLETVGLVVSIKDRVLKMTKGSMVVLKAVRQNKIYYLKGSTVTGQVATLTNSNDDSTRLCVTPRSHGYGDVTATYIRRSEVPSCIYAKHQYNKNQSTTNVASIHMPT